jgi:hypothetical protein
MGLSQQIPMKYRGSLWNTSKSFIQINLEEMDEFLDLFHQRKLKQEI